jgi:hypothetical protein
VKRLILFLLLFSLFCCWLFGAEAEKENNWTFDLSPASLNIADFNDEDLSPAASLSIASLSVSFSMGIGYHLDIIPHLLSPGIYGEFGMGYLSFVAVLLNGNTEDDYEENPVGGLWLGIRLFNRFSFGSFHIQPFIGVSTYFLSDMWLPVSTYGVLFAYKTYGLEYSFHLPFEGRDKVYYVHRLSFVFHLDG